MVVAPLTVCPAAREMLVPISAVEAEMLVVLVTPALIAILPLEPDDVASAMVLPEIELDAVMVPSAVTLTLPAVDILALILIPALTAFVFSEMEPAPFNVIAPPTVNVPPAVTSTVGALVEEMAPVLTVEEAVIVKLWLPRVMVLPLFVNVPPVRRVRLAAAVKLVPVENAALSDAEPIVKLVALILASEAIETLNVLDPPMLTLSVVFGINNTLGALRVAFIETFLAVSEKVPALPAEEESVMVTVSACESEI